MEAIERGPGAGLEVAMLGTTLTFKAVGDETDGAYSLVEARADPGGIGPLAHAHTDREELFYVLEGDVEFRIGERWLEPKPAGSCVLVPRGVVHAFRNLGGSPARLLILHSPAMDRYFVALADLLSSGPSHPDAVLTLMRDHGMDVPPS